METVRLGQFFYYFKIEVIARLHRNCRNRTLQLYIPHCACLLNAQAFELQKNLNYGYSSPRQIIFFVNYALLTDLLYNRSAIVHDSTRQVLLK